jgi:hypothetical protein
LTKKGKKVKRPPFCSARERWTSRARCSCVASIWRNSTICGTLRQDAAVERATASRIPLSGTDISTMGSGGRPSGDSRRIVALASFPAAACRTSSSRMRPLGPDPERRAKSTLSCRARSRVLGAAATTGVLTEGWDAVLVGDSATLKVSFSAASRVASIRASNEPTVTVAPACTDCSRRMPEVGAGNSTAALSVVMTTIDWSSETAWPGATSHSTICASAIPSPTSGKVTSTSVVSLTGPPTSVARQRAHARHWE